MHSQLEQGNRRCRADIIRSFHRKIFVEEFTAADNHKISSLGLWFRGGPFRDGMEESATLSIALQWLGSSGINMALMWK
jgi:hypothetical protein